MGPPLDGGGLFFQHHGKPFKDLNRFERMEDFVGVSIFFGW